MAPPTIDRSRAHVIQRGIAHGFATASATADFVRRRSMAVKPHTLGRSGLQISAVGFGCHRLEDIDEQRNALAAAIKCGCNFIDVSPNYTDGAAERAVGDVLSQLFEAGEVHRQELVVSTKVGNIVGSALKSVSSHTLPGVVQIREDVWHCLEPAWIEEELTRSLERLCLDCVDVLLLHCPEFASKASGVDMDEVYRRIARAFAHLEEEVARGRVMRYGVSAAFYPLRPSDPEHLLLERLFSVLPLGHHFEVIQFPLNFAEPQAVLRGHTLRRADGAAVDKEQGIAAQTLVQMAKQHGIATLTNRPLDGLYGELRGVMRFASNGSFNNELQEEDHDALEAKLVSLGGPALGDAEEPVTMQLAAKTVKVLASLEGVDCVLVGMRQVEYVAGIVQLLGSRPPLDAQVALETLKSAHNSLSMWFSVAAQEAEDSGTARDWRLPSRL